MKRVAVFLLVLGFIFSSTSSYAYTNWQGESLSEAFGTIDGAWAPANVDTVPASNNHNKREIDLKALYEEFERFWYVKNEEDRQDRFEEFLRTKNLDPDDIEGYDEFLEETLHVYDLESLYDEFERSMMTI